MEELMQKPWFEKHRPLDINDVVFESSTIEDQMKGFIDKGYIQGNIISYGPGGVGKTTLNKILLLSIVKNREDFFVLGKSVTDIERLKSWLLDMPLSSKQRIVICEEFDQLSTQAQTALKDGLMEKYMPKVAYIVTTNNIHSIDPALLQRFNIKIDFRSYDVDGCYFRMKKILEEESIIYDDNELYQLVISFEKKGIRELINTLQASSITGTFSLNAVTAVSTSGIEDSIVSYIKYFIQVIMAAELDDVYNICLTPTQNQTINEFYTPMLDFMDKDPSINYEHIYKTLLDDHEVILPLKKVLEKAYQELKLKPLPNIQLQSCLFEMFATLYSIRGGEKRLIH